MRSSDSYRILGRDVNLTQQRAQLESDPRLKVAWGSFQKHRNALVNLNLSLKLRLCIFHAVVTTVALFGIAILPLTNGLMKQIDIV